MVRQVNPKTPTWKAMLAITIAVAGLLWHVLACVESPMAFSPDGTRLAFVTMEPYGLKEGFTVGTNAFRLMVLTDFDELTVVEETTSHMLSAPAFSPDGERICYLRIPLLTEEQLEQFTAALTDRAEAIGQAVSDDDLQWPTSTDTAGPADESADAPLLDPTDLVMPSLLFLQESALSLASQPLTPVQLVVRDAGTLEVVSTVTVPVPLAWLPGEGPPEPDNPDEPAEPDTRWYSAGLFTAYTLMRPRYDPDGQWVYFCLGNMVMAVDPAAEQAKVLAFPAVVAALSPDGGTIAALLSDESGLVVMFVSTDRSLVVSRRLDTSVSPWAMVWTDNDTLALVPEVTTGPDQSDEEPVILLLRRDGSDAGTITLDVDDASSMNDMSQLAIAPDGRHMVLCLPDHVFFFDGQGQLLADLENDTEEEWFTQPAFTPDSTHVAIKYLGPREDEAYGGVTHIVLFTSEGEEVARAEVPPIAPGTVTLPDAPTPPAEDTGPDE